MAESTRWMAETGPGHSQWYIERFRRLAAEGADLAGEARLIDAMLPRRARVLDAGCGPGRVGAELFARGHDVVGVDVDPELIAAAETDHPGPRWIVADLAGLDLVAHGEPQPFDGAVCAGNVMVFIAPGTEADVLRGIARHLAPGGFLVTGFATDRELSLATFDAAVDAAGLHVDSRFATWDLLPHREQSDFAVSVLRAH